MAGLKRRGLGFPQELCELVIDLLCTHPPSLKACSLVCRAWHHRSQRHLFSVILRRVSIASDLRRLLQELPHITHNLRTLDIILYTTADLPALHDSLGMISQPIHLTLYLPGHLKIFDHKCDSRHCVQTRRIETLCLDFSPGNQKIYHQLLLVLHVFREIGTLELHVVGDKRGSFGIPSMKTFPYFVHPVAVSSLKLELAPQAHGSTSPYPSIRKLLDLGSLKHFGLLSFVPAAVVDCGKFLREAGSSLESLELDFMLSKPEQRLISKTFAST